MNKDIESLFRFQIHYINRLLEGIDDDIAFDKQEEGFNSAGWIVGHLCVEGVDALHKIGGEFEVDDSLISKFAYSGRFSTVDLPNLNELKLKFNEVYEKLWNQGLSLSSQELLEPPQSDLLEKAFKTTSAWLGHHLTTHLAIHAGNLSVWRRMMGLDVNGY